MKVQRILFPTDFSDLSKTAETSACDYTNQFGAELHVLHVLPDLLLTMPQKAAGQLISRDILADVANSAEEEIQKIPSTAWAFGKKVVRAVRVGPICDTISKYAKDNAIDLIVIGTHGRTGLPHVLLGSVAERVVQHAPCSVLTVRADTSVQSSQDISQSDLKST